MSVKNKGARHFTIVDNRPWGDIKEFLEKHHIQGAGSPGFANITLELDKEIFAVMTFSKSRKGVGGGRIGGPVELLRFCTDGSSIPGAASRLFSHFLKKHSPSEIISYCDLRWGTGDVYEKLGMTKIGRTDPNYWYITNCNNLLIREHRYKFTKHKLVEQGYDLLKTEK